jgi:uncharacterized protein (TIGR02598 family)
MLLQFLNTPNDPTIMQSHNRDLTGMQPSRRRVRGHSRGFSLVEMALALGVMSFAMVPLIGVLPSGLSTFKQAMSSTIESEIVQRLTNDMLLSNFSTLGTYTTSYYDHEGMQVSQNSPDLVYTATLKLTSVSKSNSPADLANATAADIVLITITSKSNPNQPHQYSVVLANNGQ